MIETETFSVLSNVYLVFGGIYLRFAHRCFPGSNWTDYVLIVGWWMENLTKIVLKKSKTEQFHFMGGAYQFTLREVESQNEIRLCQVSLIEERTVVKQNNLQELYSLQAIADELILTSEIFELELRNKGFSQNLIQDLKTSRLKLIAAINPTPKT